MMRIKFIPFFCLILFSFALQAAAQTQTTVAVRAKAKDAKFIGDGMGGAMITILDTATGDTLAHGLTKGGTGDTQRLVKEPVGRYDTLSTPGAAKFEAQLNLQKPTLVTIQASAPYGEPKPHITSSTQKWIIPGKDITGDGVILEIPGFSVANQLPDSNKTYQAGQSIPIKAHIVMMCGCPTSDGRLWDSSEYEIKAQIRKGAGGKIVDEVPLSYTGETSLFSGSFTPQSAGKYHILVYVFHPKTGNTGVAKTKIMVSN